MARQSNQLSVRLSDEQRSRLDGLAGVGFAASFALQGLGLAIGAVASPFILAERLARGLAVGLAGLARAILQAASKRGTPHS